MRIGGKWEWRNGLVPKTCGFGPCAEIHGCQSLSGAEALNCSVLSSRREDERSNGTCTATLTSQELGRKVLLERYL